MKKTKLRRQSLKPIKKLDRECEQLAKQITLKITPNCENCGAPATLAHHYIRRSKSMNTKFCLSNLIPLCQKCHFLIHNAQDSTIEARIAVKRGQDWLDNLTLMSRVKILSNRAWLSLTRETLLAYIDKLNGVL